MNISNKEPYVKVKIVEATLSILMHKSYKELTIKEIILTSKISKSSFYRYFKSSEDIIKYTANKLNFVFFNDKNSDKISNNFTIEVFEFVNKYKKFYYVLYLNDLLNLSLNYTLQYISNTNDTNEIQYKKSIFIHSIYGLLEVWFKNGCVESPEEIQRIVNSNLKLVITPPSFL